MIRDYLTLDAVEIFDGSIEIDERYFEGVCMGKRGREAAGKGVVFGILKREVKFI